MKLFALTVGRNERYRYLSPMLAYMKNIIDEHFFYDDQSDDGTEKLAEAAGCKVVVRPDDVSPFSQDEGLFRGAAWAAFEKTMDPQLGDWVLVIDCDEVLISCNSVDPVEVKHTIDCFISLSEGRSIMLMIPEIFGFDDDGVPLHRVDRLWPTIHAPRLFPYHQDGHYTAGEVGVPAVPSYVMHTDQWVAAGEVTIMHYGYSCEEDQKIKYQRYAGRIGHSNDHIESILAPDKELVRWTGPFVESMSKWKQ